MQALMSMQPFEPAMEFVRALQNPTIAYLLLVFGLTGLLFEVSFPGHFLPGIAGTVFTLLALYLFGTLPVNFVGVVFVVIAFILLAAEVLAPGLGMFGAGGVVTLILGSLLLASTGQPMAVSPWASGAVVLFFAGLFLAVGRGVARLQRRPAVNGREGLVGRVGEAKTGLDPEGYVLVDGELWRAVSPLGGVATHAKVKVLEVEGRRLVVYPVDDPVVF